MLGKKNVSMSEIVKKRIKEMENKFSELKDSSLVKIPVNKLVENPYQPRQYMDEEKIESLKNSIKEIGLLQPVLVTEDQENEGKYIIIAGHRRVEAMKRLGWNEIPVFIKKKGFETKEDIESSLHLMAIIENLQRENLNLFEEAVSLLSLSNMLGSKSLAAKKLGISSATFTKKISVLGLHEKILKDIEQNNSTKDINALYLLKKVKEPEKQIEFYYYFLENGREALDSAIKKYLNQGKNNQDNNQDNNKVIAFKKKKNKLVVEINKKDLTEDQIQKIEEFLTSILS